MTTKDKRLALALKKANDELTELPDSPEARARTVAALQAAMRSSSAKVVAKRGPWRLALAASLPLLLGAGWWMNAQRLAVGSVVETGHRLSNAELVDSGEGVMTLALRHGVKVQLRAQTAVELRDDGTRVLVRRGEVAAEVTSLDAPFTVESFDTQVATRAGRFQVKPGAGCDGRAEVSVSEGAVLINGGTELHAGETWPSCPKATTPSQPVEPPVVMPAPVAPRPVVSKKNAPPPPVAVKQNDDDHLTRQNELYQQAVTLQRAGDVSGAVKKLEAVLVDQRSPLAETALAQKMRWLSESDGAAAREVARDYLQRFPMGFGRAEAETLVLDSK